MNKQYEFWSRPWHVLQRSLADEVQRIVAPVDPGQRSGTSAVASLSLSWLARARAPAQVLARRGQ